MTRRQMIHGSLPFAAGTLACAPRTDEILTALTKLETTDNLAIVGPSIEARSTRGEFLGSIKSLRPAGGSSYAVSLDGMTLAWFDHKGTSDADDPRLFVRDIGGNSRSIPIPGNPNGIFAISRGCERVVSIVVTKNNERPRLIIFEGHSGVIEHDLTDVFALFSVREIERLQVSADGTVVAIGWRNSLAVIKVPQLKIVFQSGGRFPTLSPDARLIAFIDHSNKVIVRRPEESENVTPSFTGFSADATGAWSPDGNLFLVGSRLLPSSEPKLIVTNARMKGIVALFDLSLEGDLGSRRVWIKKNFL